ncbi:DUF7239 family protein [Streptomyces fumanus]|uniref:DUF7239 family protein n=1 Tax=Streptomyces fumanus TaxID=67302 RepID=UPI0033C007E9
MADPREARLPKWAQEELSRLRRSLVQAEARNAELRGKVGKTNTHVQNFGQDDQPLPNGSTVRFQLRSDHWDQYVSARVERGRLSLLGGRSLLVLPHVSNALYLSLRDD